MRFAFLAAGRYLWTFIHVIHFYVELKVLNTTNCSPFQVCLNPSISDLHLRHFQKALCTMPENKSIVISFCYNPQKKVQEEKDKSKSMLSILSTERLVTVVMEGSLVCTYGLPVALVICVHGLLFHCDSF